MVGKPRKYTCLLSSAALWIIQSDNFEWKSAQCFLGNALLAYLKELSANSLGFEVHNNSRHIDNENQ